MTQQQWTKLQKQVLRAENSARRRKRYNLLVRVPAGVIFALMANLGIYGVEIITSEPGAAAQHAPWSFAWTWWERFLAGLDVPVFYGCIAAAVGIPMALCLAGALLLLPFPSGACSISGGSPLEMARDMKHRFTVISDLRSSDAAHFWVTGILATALSLGYSGVVTWNNIQFKGVVSIIEFLLVTLLLGIIFLLINVVAYLILSLLTGLLHMPRKTAKLEKELDDLLGQLEEEEKARIRQEKAAQRAAAEALQRQQEEARKAAAAEKARQDRQEGEALYQMALAMEEPDEYLIEQAAKLGQPEACLYLGTQLLLDAVEKPMTQQERSAVAESCQKYLETAKNLSIDANFLYLVAQTQFSSHTALQWEGILAQVRRIQNSCRLSEDYEALCSATVEQLMELVKRAYEKEERATHRRAEENRKVNMMAALSAAGSSGNRPSDR